MLKFSEVGAESFFEIKTVPETLIEEALGFIQFQISESKKAPNYSYSITIEGIREYESPVDNETYLEIDTTFEPKLLYKAEIDMLPSSARIRYIRDNKGDWLINDCNISWKPRNE